MPKPTFSDTNLVILNAAAARDDRRGIGLANSEAGPIASGRGLGMKPGTSVADQIAAIRDLDRDALVARWRSIYDQPPPRGIGQSLRRAQAEDTEVPSADR